MTQPSTRPIFIIGVHRSGTTLLRYMLSSHPNIYIPPESDFIPYFFLKNPAARLSQVQVSNILSIIFTRYRFVGEWQASPPDAAEFYSSLPEPTPSAFLNELYSRYAHQNGKFRWGDKTPIYSSYVGLLADLFPAAQFIHILRDPRDAALSLLEKYQAREFHIDIYYAARNWVRRIQHTRSAAQAIPPGQYMELHYEDLVKQPELHLKNICNFLEEDFYPTMLEQHRLARVTIPQDSHFFSNVRQPVNDRSLGRWQTALSVQDARLVQTVTAPLMEQLGYQPADLGKLSLPELLRMAGLSAKYTTLQVGRRILQSFGLFPPI